MFEKVRSPRRRDLRPSLDPLEERALLNAASLHHPSDPKITILNQVGGYRFTNFDGPNAGNTAGTGTNMNGISNSGTAVGFLPFHNDGTFYNFTANPLKTTKARLVNINGSTTAMAFGINSAGTVVGTDGHRERFLPQPSRRAEDLHPPWRYVRDRFRDQRPGEHRRSVRHLDRDAGVHPGSWRQVFHHDQRSLRELRRTSSTPRESTTTAWWWASISATTARSTVSLRVIGPRRTAPSPAPQSRTRPSQPSRGNPVPRLCSPRSLGSTITASRSATTATPPPVSTALSTTPTPGKYTFLDDPSEAFDNGVEVTQITGITNSGEITGFYSDANGVFHGFVATTHLA